MHTGSDVHYCSRMVGTAFSLELSGVEGKVNAVFFRAWRIEVS